jgi:hypothetical protein
MKWSAVGWVSFLFAVWTVFVAFVGLNIKYFGVLVGAVAIIGEIIICFAICIAVLLIANYLMGFFGDKE